MINFRFALKEGAGTGWRSLRWCKIVRQPLGRWEFLLFVGAGWGGRKYWAASPSAPDAATRKLHQVRGVCVCVWCVWCVLCTCRYSSASGPEGFILVCGAIFLLQVTGGRWVCRLLWVLQWAGKTEPLQLCLLSHQKIHFPINIGGLNNFKN